MTADLKEIRQITAARLIAANTLAGANVFKARTNPWLDQDGAAPELPGIAVYTSQTSFESIGQAAPHLRSTTPLVLAAALAGTANDWENLDDFAQQVLSALLQDADWVKNFEEIAGGDIALDYPKEGERPLGVAVITLRLVYVAEWPPIVETEVQEMKVDWDMASPRLPPQTPAEPDGQIDAEDTLTGLQS